MKDIDHSWVVQVNPDDRDVALLREQLQRTNIARASSDEGLGMGIFLQKQLVATG